MCDHLPSKTEYYLIDMEFKLNARYRLISLADRCRFRHNKIYFIVIFGNLPGLKVKVIDLNI